LRASDGTDHGRDPALAEASRWRHLGCPIHTFACGSPRTTPLHNDVALTSISTRPAPFVPVKGKLSVTVLIDARGYERSKARVRLFVEHPGKAGEKERAARGVLLEKTTGNEGTLSWDAPATASEAKARVTVETPDPDDFPLNNVIETFVTVSKEGISVLLVDRPRAGEPQSICDALSPDPRIRVTPVWLRGGRALR